MYIGIFEFTFRTALRYKAGEQVWFSEVKKTKDNKSCDTALFKICYQDSVNCTFFQVAFSIFLLFPIQRAKI
jgi:hypothetical protein